MKTFSKVLVGAMMVIASTFAAKAQNSDDKNNMNLNANYKHQVPVSEGTKFKDSFQNDKMIDLTADNYKQPKYKKVTKKRVFKDNFNNIAKTNTVNSKHPYGL
ncbi:MAG TPA: hypothetical protein VK766_01005 [Cytophagaceae bacterium]|jgi:hypothetical protein|nr:hypothetical protein [Cytophagaceae bacterium]